MRKKWTPQEELSEYDQLSKEKKKWQIALRRYVLDKNPSRYYAPFFGVDIETFRSWIAAQFTDELNWDNFGKTWQFEHIIPISYFSNETEDLRLCWNFTNIVVSAEALPNKPDILSAKKYYQTLFDVTGYDRCQLMLDKIQNIESTCSFEPQLSFCEDKKEILRSISSFQENDFERLNNGEELKDLLLEKEILLKFGS